MGSRQSLFGGEVVWFSEPESVQLHARIGLGLDGAEDRLAQRRNDNGRATAAHQCGRQGIRSATETPASCSFRMPMICSSVNRLRLMFWSCGWARTNFKLDWLGGATSCAFVVRQPQTTPFPAHRSLALRQLRDDPFGFLALSLHIGSFLGPSAIPQAGPILLRCITRQARKPAPCFGKLLVRSTPAQGLFKQQCSYAAGEMITQV